jgi:hypothetical protein
LPASALSIVFLAPEICLIDHFSKRFGPDVESNLYIDSKHDIASTSRVLSPSRRCQARRHTQRRDQAHWRRSVTFLHVYLGSYSQTDFVTVETYFAYPKDTSPTNSILFLTDVFGLGLTSSKLLADQLAANGYLVLIPDLFNKDPIPVERPAGFDMGKWRAGPPGHGVETVDPIVQAVITEMRGNLGVKKLGAVGYCFGAKYVVRFLKDGVIDAGYIAHPSLVEASELEAIQGPLSIAAPGKFFL